LLEKALQVSTGSNGLLSPYEKPKFQNRNPFIPEEHIELCKSLTLVVDLLKSGIHHADLIGWYVHIKGQITIEGIIHAIEPICQKTVLIQPLYSEQRQIVSIELVSIVNWNETICGSTVEEAPKVNPELEKLEPQKPLIWKVGDRVSWKNAPSWWNPTGEEII
jgi:hypothetical protein